jgi:hypothetical protein
MLGLKGQRIASLYLRTIAVNGVPTKVMVKSEDNGDHHLPAKMVISSCASLRSWQMCVSMVWIRVYTSLLNGLKNSILAVSNLWWTFHLVVAYWWLGFLVVHMGADIVVMVDWGIPLLATRFW